MPFAHNYIFIYHFKRINLFTYILNGELITTKYILHNDSHTAYYELISIKLLKQIINNCTISNNIAKAIWFGERIQLFKI